MPGGGAQFSLFFPCNDLVPEAAAAQEGGAFGPSQTVLVVDDKSSLVRLAEEMLAGLGYEPVGFCSSEQALAAFKADPNRFILLLTDEVTPQLTGTTLASAVRAIRPQRPVVMASGYGGPQVAAGRAASADICLLVAKPLVRAELARAMQQRLRQEPAQGSTYA